MTRKGGACIPNALNRSIWWKSKVKKYSHNFLNWATKIHSTLFLQALAVGLITLTNPCLLSLLSLFPIVISFNCCCSCHCSLKNLSLNHYHLRACVCTTSNTSGITRVLVDCCMMWCLCQYWWRHCCHLTTSKMTSGFKCLAAW
jgi:hypothetical protein